MPIGRLKRAGAGPGPADSRIDGTGAVDLNVERWLLKASGYAYEQKLHVAGGWTFASDKSRIHAVRGAVAGGGPVNEHLGRQFTGYLVARYATFAEVSRKPLLAAVRGKEKVFLDTVEDGELRIKGGGEVVTIPALVYQPFVAVYWAANLAHALSLNGTAVQLQGCLIETNVLRVRYHEDAFAILAPGR